VRVVVAGILVGAPAWYAWDRGYIPGNPRALTLEAMRHVVERADRAEMISYGMACAGPDIESPPAAEVRGLPLLELAASPGLYVVTLQKVAFQGQGTRMQQLAQFEFFTQQGYFTARDLVVESVMGPIAAREFRLTWEGFAASTGTSSGSPCFVAGKLVFDDLVNFREAPPGEDGFTFYDVAYRSKFKPVTKWAQSGAPQGLFPYLDEKLKYRDKQVRLYRASDGWMTFEDFKSKLFVADPERWKKIQANGLINEPTPINDAVAKTVFMDYLKTPAGLRSIEEQCLRLELSGTGDDRDAAKRGFSNVITYEDKADRPESQRRDIARRITTLETLVAMRLAVRQNGNGPMPQAGLAALPQSPVSGKGAPPPAQGPGWVRYTIDPAAADMLGLNRGGGCIGLGTPKIEFFGVVPSYAFDVDVVGRVRFDDPPELARKFAERLPSVQFALSEGLALRTPLRYGAYSGNPGVDDGKWQVMQVGVILPRMRGVALPAEVQPLLPLMVASMSPDYRATANAMAPAAPKPAAATAPVPSPTQLQTSATGVPVASADVHVISVYEAVNGVTLNDTSQGNRQGSIPVQVGSSAKPLWLLLSSYEPVHWIVNVSPGSKLDRIVASGYYPQRVTVTGKQGVEILMSRDGPGYDGGKIGGISSWVRQQYHADPISVQTVYKGGNFMVGSAGSPAAVASSPATRPVVPHVPVRKTGTLMCGRTTIVCDSGDTVICGGQRVTCPVGQLP
jgi:hypothetical protein